MDNIQAYEDYNKVKTVIKSCNNEEQLRVAVRLFNLFLKKYGGELDDQYLHTLKQLIGLMRIKCLDKEEINEISPSGEAFYRETRLSKTPELQRLNFEGDEKKLEEEINIGTQIERNFVDNDDEARKIATANIDSVGNYYTDPDYGIVGCINNIGDKRSIRINKSDMDNLHTNGNIEIDDINLTYDEELQENLDMNDITTSLRDQLKKRNSRKYSKEEIYDEIRKRREIELDRRRKENDDWASLWDEEEIEESTGAASGGAYVGPMTKEVVRRVIKKDIPVSANGIVGKRQAGLPIGKLYSFSENNEILEEEDEIDEAVDYAGAVGAYDTPGFAPSKFMGTLGKKGKAPVNKGVTHEKLAYPGGEFVKIKNKCAHFPYCNQSPSAIKLSKTPFKGAFYESKTLKKRNLKIKK